MGSFLEETFPDDWRDILDAYMDFLASSGAEFSSESLPLALVEVGVRFGRRLSELPLNGFVEIGCGLAIPSLTLAKLGRAGGKAVDVDPALLACAQQLGERLGCRVQYQCRDIFADRPSLQNGELLIAEKPASYKSNTLEVEYNISNWCKIEGHNIAMIPSFLKGDSIPSYSERCAQREKKFRQVGFKVENRQVYEALPYRWLIATKPQPGRTP